MISIAGLAVLVATAAVLLAGLALMVAQREKRERQVMERALERVIAEQEIERRVRERGTILEFPRDHAHRPEKRMGLIPDRSVERERA